MRKIVLGQILIELAFAARQEIIPASVDSTVSEHPQTIESDGAGGASRENQCCGRNGSGEDLDQDA